MVHYQIMIHHPHKNVPQATIFVWIIVAVATIGEAYNFTIRGDCELGLCLTMMFTMEEYAALLLANKLVKVKEKRAGDTL